jgi:murein lipoprotein
VRLFFNPSKGTTLMNYKSLTLIAVLTSLLSLGGCASTSQLKAVEAKADQATATANAAAADAQAAKAMAQEAKDAAAAAQAKADETDAKVDRMFEKAMHK